MLLYELNITGNPLVHQFPDYYGNLTGTFSLLLPHQELSIDARMVVRTLAAHRVQSKARIDELTTVLDNNLHLLEMASPDAIELQDFISSIILALNVDNQPVADIVQRASAYVFEHFKYIKGITHVETTIDEILNQQAGVCQDFAHVLLQILRTMRIPSRYVSGYICPNKNGMRGEGATHAWIEAFIPGHGWAGIDPTNNVWVYDTHVKLAVGRHFNDCSPVKGNFRGTAGQRLSVFVSVGYEDGQTYEDLNNVKTGIEPETPISSVPAADMQQ